MKKIDHDIVIVVIYLDDLIVIRNNNVDIFDLKKLLKKNFEMKNLGKLHYFLGIKVIKSLKKIWLSCRQYALNKLFKYGMTCSRPISISLGQNVKLNANRGELVEDIIMYKHIVGSLIFMTITRANLSYAIKLMYQLCKHHKSHIWM
jgi:hypothetical protein